MWNQISNCYTWSEVISPNDTTLLLVLLHPVGAVINQMASLRPSESPRLRRNYTHLHTLLEGGGGCSLGSGFGNSFSSFLTSAGEQYQLFRSYLAIRNSLKATSSFLSGSRSLLGFHLPSHTALETCMHQKKEELYYHWMLSRVSFPHACLHMLML